ncbi:MAG TPA: elongation factor G [Rhodothermales bacterium]|nr:elongation factor G [Rhodothermales bacterium]
MKVYDADHIRNVVLVGHQGSGKTMLAEAMLYASGSTRRMGTIEEGNTLSDYHDSEKERQMSIFASLLHTEWKGHKINVLDTPGYPDFVGEVVASMKVADTAIYVMNAAEGVEVGTELAWTYGTQTNKPSMFVINHLDKSQADFRALVTQIKERFGRGATVVQIPGGAGSRSIIDVLLMKQLSFPENQNGKAVISEIDDAFRAEAEELHNALIEDIAENDESLMELYFEQGELNEDQMREGLHEAMLRRDLFPIFVTSATANVGVSRLMSFIDNVCPSPAEMPPAETEQGDPVNADPHGEPVLFIFRTMAEQHVGDYSFFRVYSGTVEQGMDLENAQTGSGERLGQLYAIDGRERDQVQKMMAGDLGALVKLRDTHTNDTLRKKGSNVVIKPIEFPEPRYSSSIQAVNEGEEDKIAQGLHQLVAEDPSLLVHHDPHLNQMVLGGQGELHLKIAQYRLKNQAGVDIDYTKPRVAYRETVRSSARASYRHKKQTGGAGQFADISMVVEPLEGEYHPPADIKVRGVAEVETDWGSKIEFIDGIVGGVIDMRRFFGAIQKGILEAAPTGPIAGYPIGDVRIVIYDGGMHSVDSNENAFKTAARMCFRDGFRQASPAILEPIYDVEITVPDTYMGDVIGDLNTRRGRIQGMESEGIFQKVLAQVPEAELYRYSTALRSITQGRGLHKATFSHYEPMPRHVQDQLMAEAEEMAEA